MAMRAKRRRAGSRSPSAWRPDGSKLNSAMTAGRSTRKSAPYRISTSLGQIGRSAGSAYASCDRSSKMRDTPATTSAITSFYFERPFNTNRICDGTVSDAFDRLVAEIRVCAVCAPHLPLGPRPILRGRPSARLLIISQAPGTRVHETGLSFNDRSGDRLRAWLALDRETFYDETRVVVMPIGFCYPGRDAKGGDLPPRRECAPLWHARLRMSFPDVELTLLIGRYA